MAPLKGRTLRAYSGNRFIAVFDRDEQDPLAIEAACRLARTLTLAQGATAEGPLDMNVIAASVERLTVAVDDARAIGRGITAARKGINSIESSYETLRQAVKSIIREISEELV